MAHGSSSTRPESPIGPNGLRSTSRAARRTEPASPADELDSVDRVILAALSANARIPNNALAERAGIAASTCLGRVRLLRDRGGIRGFHAATDPAATGRPIQAMIAVRMQSHARSHLREFAASVAELPEVL